MDPGAVLPAVGQVVDRRPEDGAGADVPHVERGDPETISTEHDPSRPSVVHRSGPEPVQSRPDPVPPLPVRAGEHLGVGRGPEANAVILQLLSQLPVIEDLAVKRDDHAPRVGDERLVAS